MKSKISVQDVYTFVLMAVIIVMVFNTRRVLRVLEAASADQEVIIIEKPRDYEKDITEQFDSIRNVVRATDSTSTKLINDRFLKDLNSGGVSFKRYSVDTAREGTSHSRTNIKVQGSK